MVSDASVSSGTPSVAVSDDADVVGLYVPDRVRRRHLRGSWSLPVNHDLEHGGDDA